MIHLSFTESSLAFDFCFDFARHLKHYNMKDGQKRKTRGSE
jgi:hypothetical protein